MDATELGSLEKTVIASLLHSGLHSGSTVRSRFKKTRLRKNLDLRKIVGTIDFLVNKLFDLRKIF